MEEPDDNNYVEPAQNDQLLLIVGESTSGKSTALRNVRNQERCIYLNFEAGKKLPFKNSFNEYKITDPEDIFPILQYVIDNPDEIEGVYLDSITFMMDMYESLYVNGAADGRKAWGAYHQFFKRLMQEYVPLIKCPVVMLAHTRTERDEKTLISTTSVPVKGALKNVGVEAYFSTVIATKRIAVKDLEDYAKDNELLNITPREKALGFKYVFQTQITKTTTGERIRGPFDLWSDAETFTDNDAASILDRIISYYG